jgi:hypothetical protein
MQHQMIEKYMARPLRWVLQNNVSYWHQVLYSFSHANGHYQLQPAAEQQRGRVVIVSRAHYQEYVQHYPITQLSELKQVLKTEYQHNELVLHYIGPVHDQRRTVCSIVMSDDVVQRFNHSCVLIPESLLLWQAFKLTKPAATNTVYQVGAFAGYFLYCGADTPVSQRINHFCPDFPSFALNNGISDLARCQQLPDAGYADHLMQALGKALPRLAKFALLRRPGLTATHLPVKNMLITAAAITTCYVVLVSGYYQLMLNKRQAQLTQFGADVNMLLDTQQQLQQVDSAAQQLASLRADKAASAHLWQVIIPLLQQDSSLALQNFSNENGRLVLRGQAQQATAVLTTLQSSALVADARFEASVRRQRDKDIFVISLQLIQQPMAADADSTALNSTMEANRAAE